MSRNLAKQFAQSPGLKILDGSMGNYLTRYQGVPFNSSIWSLAALIEEKYHLNVVNAHELYLKSGCNIITTNTYSCTPLYLSKINKINELESLYNLSIHLAQNAKDRYLSNNQLFVHQQNNNISIAVGIPPLMESFRSDLLLSESESIYFYNRIFKELNNNNNEFDIYLIETMSCLKEAKYVLNAMICNNHNNDKDIYLFFALREDGLLRDNQDFNSMIISLNEYFDVLPIKYIGLNCVKPETFDISMNNLNENTMNILDNKNVFIGCYPNGFTEIPKECSLEKDGSHSNMALNARGLPKQSPPYFLHL